MAAYTSMARLLNSGVINIVETEIIKVKGDWEEVVNDCRSTVGKDELGKEPSENFKKAILIAEHSPIRNISIKWCWRKIKSWIATHWVRHKWECYVRSQRSDRTGVPRDKLPQDALVSFTGEANIQHLIDTARKRLCFEASPETRLCMEDLKISIHDDVDPYIANVLVPNCIYRCGCPEMGDCVFFNKLRKAHPAVASTNIQERYDAYNMWFYRNRGGDVND